MIISDERKRLADDCRRIAEIMYRWSDECRAKGDEEWRHIYVHQGNGAKRCADFLSDGDPCIEGFSESK